MYARTYDDGREIEVRDNGDVYTKSVPPAPPFTDSEGWQYQETLPNHSGTVEQFVEKYGLLLV